RLIGVVTRQALRRWLEQPAGPTHTLDHVTERRPVVAYDDEPLRVIVYRMAETGLTRLPVVGRDGSLVGIVGLNDLLGARVRNLEAEQRRERVLGTRLRLKSVFGKY